MSIFTINILEALTQQRHEVPVGSRWRHKKGGTYEVTGYGFDTEREQLNVLYRRIGGPNFDALLEASLTYCRPAAEWTDDRFKEVL